MVLDTFLLNTLLYKLKGVAPSLTLLCSSYWKGSLLVALDCGRQFYFTHSYIHYLNLHLKPFSYCFFYFFIYKRMNLNMVDIYDLTLFSYLLMIYPFILFFPFNFSLLSLNSFSFSFFFPTLLLSLFFPSSLSLFSSLPFFVSLPSPSSSPSSSYSSSLNL